MFGSSTPSILDVWENVSMNLEVLSLAKDPVVSKRRSFFLLEAVGEDKHPQGSDWVR